MWEFFLLLLLLLRPREEAELILFISSELKTPDVGVRMRFCWGFGM